MAKSERVESEAKGYFDDMAVFNKPASKRNLLGIRVASHGTPCDFRRFGHEISKPKLRPGGADTTPDCQKAQASFKCRVPWSNAVF